MIMIRLPRAFIFSYSGRQAFKYNKRILRPCGRFTVFDSFLDGQTYSVVIAPFEMISLILSATLNL
jgi:hypothetical protein